MSQEFSKRAKYPSATGISDRFYAFFHFFTQLLSSNCDTPLPESSLSVSPGIVAFRPRSVRRTPGLLDLE